LDPADLHGWIHALLQLFIYHFISASGDPRIPVTQHILAKSYFEIFIEVDDATEQIKKLRRVKQSASISKHGHSKRKLVSGGNVIVLSRK
jgi:hypothetical protein